MSIYKKSSVLFSILMVVTMVLGGCSTPTPEIIEKVVTQIVKETVVQKETVKETVIVQGTPQVVEKEVTKIIEVTREVVVPATPEPQPEKKILRIGMAGTPKSLNPFLSESSADHEAVVYAHCKLGRFSPELTVVPYLADWEVSEDGTTFTFHINEDAKWHDGEPVTAKDVVFTYWLAAHPETGVIYYDRIKDIKGAQAFHDGEADDVEGLKVVDDKTVQITLEAPSAAWLGLSQSCMFIVPEHILGSIDPKEVMDAPYWRNPVGCGPFKWVEYATDQYIHYEKFEDYFWGAPKIDELYLTVGTLQTQAAAFKAGELDLVQVAPEEIESFKELDYATLHRGESYVYDIDLNHRRPFLGDAKFRKALMYAIDRQNIVDAVFFGYATVAPNIFVAPWTLSPNITEYTYDPEKAKELLEEAGWDGSYDFGMISSGSAIATGLGLIVQQNLADVGIKSHIEIVQSSLEKLSAGDYDMAFDGYGTMSLLPQAAQGYMGADALPPGGANWCFYEDRELTDLFEQAAVEMDPEARQQIFYKITERTTDQLPMIYLAVSEVVLAANNRVHIPNVVYVPRNRPGDFTWLTWNIHEWDIVE